MNSNKELPKTTIVDTSSTLEDGQNKCEKCGSTETSLNIETGMLRCHWCRHEQLGVGFEKHVTNIEKLKGEIIGSGATEIVADAEDVLTFKCSSCASEVIIDTKDAPLARCHWCRNTLSVNQQIPNGAIPDKVLPFEVKKNVATDAIETFVSQRQFFASKKFKKEFSIDTVIGVYLPYMIVDANVNLTFQGQGEIELRTWTETRTETRMVTKTRTVGSGDNQQTETYTEPETVTIVEQFYDADRYQIIRNFDMTVEDMTIEADSEKIKHQSTQRTNNIINAIKPFDVTKGMNWNANYMTGYNAQKRDINIDDLRASVNVMIKDIARRNIRNAISEYDHRGAFWQSEEINVTGKQWTASYFPIWMYSSMEKDGTIHYIAVNGQSGKINGSIPINWGRYILVSLVVGLASGFPTWLIMNSIYENSDMERWVLWLVVAIIVIIALGIVAIIVSGYRNADARFEHESEVKSAIRNIKKNDRVIKEIRRTMASRIPERDNTRDVLYKGGK